MLLIILNMKYYFNKNKEIYSFSIIFLLFLYKIKYKENIILKIKIDL